MDNAKQQQYELSHHGKVLFTGTHKECFARVRYTGPGYGDNWAIRYKDHQTRK